jgi:hypothetical protein
MKILSRTLFILIILTVSHLGFAQNSAVPTLRTEMEEIHDKFGANFIYDSSLEIDVPAPKDVNMEGRTLEQCLDELFSGTDIQWSIQKKYVVLVHKDKKRKPRDYTIFIEEQHDTINESIVTAQTSKELNTTQTGFQKLDKIVFERGYAMFSSPDVIKAIQQLPGVASGTELLSGMYVRGGDGSDNLYLLDGVPLYQVSHLGGIFSSFNTDVLESLDFYKSGFPARYGGRMSSVVDVKTKDGDFREYHGLASIGLLDGRLQFEGPIIKDKTSFNIGLRRSWLDVLTVPTTYLISDLEDVKLRLKYAFWDLNANLTHKFSDENKLTLRIYGGRDKAKFGQARDHKYFEGEEDLSGSMYDFEWGLGWGNFVTSLNWDYRFNPSHEMSAKVYFSRYGSLFSMYDYYEYRGDDGKVEQYSISDNRNSSQTSDIGFRADFSYRPNASHHIRYGTLLQYHFYSPEHSIYNYAQAYSTVTNNEDRSYSNHAESFEPAVYIEDEMIITDWFTANVGLRYSSVWAQNKVYHNIQPRAALRFAVGDNTSIKMSYSEMAQNNHLVSSNYLSLPTSFWMPSTDKIAPSKSRQLSAGVYFNLPHNIKFNVEGYGKTMDNLLEFRGKWGIYPPIHLWEESLVVGKGRSWGVESELSWADSKTSLTAYYTLSWSQRFFEDFYQFWYKDRNDNRHKLTLTGTRRIGKKFEVYASWNYHSGGWMTSQSQAIWEGEVGKWPEMFFSYPNNLQVPDYHRLDLGCNFHKTTKRGNESIWNLSFYNAYCRINPIIAYVAERYDFTEENLAGFNFVGQAFGIIPIIPSFSYTLKF